MARRAIGGDEAIATVHAPRRPWVGTTTIRADLAHEGLIGLNLARPRKRVRPAEPGIGAMRQQAPGVIADMCARFLDDVTGAMLGFFDCVAGAQHVGDAMPYFGAVFDQFFHLRRRLAEHGALQPLSLIASIFRTGFTDDVVAAIENSIG